MKHWMRKTLACLLAICCLLPVLATAEGSELAQRMEKTLAAGRQIETVIRLEINEDLLAAGTLPEQVAGVQELLRDAEIRLCWAQDNAGPGMGRFAVVIRGTEILSGAVEAWEEGIALATSALPGKTLLIPYAAIQEALQGAMPWDQSDFPLEALAESAELYLGAVMEWLGQQQGGISLDETATAATDTRDASMAAMHVRLSAVQIKALLVALAGVMAQDPTLATLLQADPAEVEQNIGELMVAIDALKPTQAELQLDVYVSDAGDIVGVDGIVPQLFASSPGEGEFHYDVKHAEGMSAISFQGNASWADGGKATLSVRQSSMENALLGSVNDDITLRGMIKPSVAEDGIGVTIQNFSSRTPSPIGEKSTGSFGIIIEPAERPEGMLPSSTNIEDSMQWTQRMMAASWLDFRVNYTGQTWFLGDIDFCTNLEITQSQLGVMRLESFSSERQPAIDPGNAVVEVSKLDEAAQQALLEELQVGLFHAVEVALPLLPPALVEAFMAE